MSKIQEKDQDSNIEHEEDLLGLKDSFIRKVSEFIDENKIDDLHDVCLRISAVDMAELMLKLDHDDRIVLLETLETEIDPETFAEFDADVLNDLLDHISPNNIANIINELDSDDAIHLIEDLDEDRRAKVIRHLNKKLRLVVEEGLTYPEKSAGRLMQRELVAIPQFWTAGKTVNYLRAATDELPEVFSNVFVVDPKYHLTGTVHVSSLVSAKPAKKIEAIASDDLVTIPVDMDQADVAYLFRKKDLLSAPVIDEHNHLVGIITVDDVVDVIHEDAEQDVLNLSGVGEDDIHRQAIATANSRFIWLGINLVTAILASIVISMFEGSIAKLATLAVLMPIVASMGGNAGTQALAVTVIALASREITSVNTIRVIIKECLVGVINGILFAFIIGTVVFLWFGDVKLGLVISAAMTLNLLLAGFAGVAIPIGMEKLGYDPAQSAVVFLTTVTDVVGFFAFLGLASWFLI